MRNRRPLSPLLAAGFQQSLNTYFVLKVQSGSKLNENKWRLKNVFQIKFSLPSFPITISSQLGLTSLHFSLWILESDLPLSQYFLSLSADMPSFPFQTHPSTALLLLKLVSGIRRPMSPALPINPGSSGPSAPVLVPSRLSPSLEKQWRWGHQQGSSSWGTHPALPPAHVQAWGEPLYIPEKRMKGSDPASTAKQKGRKMQKNYLRE